MKIKTQHHHFFKFHINTKSFFIFNNQASFTKLLTCKPLTFIELQNLNYTFSTVRHCDARTLNRQLLFPCCS